MRIVTGACALLVAAALLGVCARHVAAYPPVEGAKSDAAKSAETGSSRSIDAVKGKQYKLTKQHGPWMIMVATFREPPPEFKTEGLTPQQAAEELVYELRKKGIPAYVFSQKDVVDQVKTTDRLGRMRSQSYVAQQGSVCVLAGNYKSADDAVAAKTLNYVKNFKPKFLAEEKGDQKKSQGIHLTQLKSGGVFRKTPGRPTPLGGAFLSLNPTLTPDEVAAREVDPLLVKLNSDSEYSLAKSTKRYTVVVASFYGQSHTKLSRGADDESGFKFKVDNSLDYAGQQAFELCHALRNGKFAIGTNTPNAPPRYKPFEAYVFHDRTRSIVTIGAFDSPNDPEIGRIIEQFRAKEVPHPTTKSNIVVAEKLMIPVVPPKHREKDPTWTPDKLWIFDPMPSAMIVPKL